MQKFIITITDTSEQIVADEQAVCHVLSTSLPLSALEVYINELRQTESLILLQGADSSELCQKYKCDGVVIEINDESSYKKQILPIRDKLGSKKIIGVIIPLLRHAAMIVGETEPEFVSFRIDSISDIERAEKLIEWYNELFLIQSAVVGQVASSSLADLGTDFVMISPKNYKILVAKKERLD